jgi:hypothetical protein
MFTWVFKRYRHRVQTEWQRPLSGVHSIMMEKFALTGEGGGGGCTQTPLPQYLPLRTKLQCTLQLRGQICVLLLFHMYSMGAGTGFSLFTLIFHHAVKVTHMCIIDMCIVQCAEHSTACRFYNSA